MRYTATAALAAALALSLGACNADRADETAATDSAAPAGSEAGINGTWVADLASAKFDAKPDVILLKDGVYECATCNPGYKVAADGAFHPVSGRPYADEIAVKIDSPTRVSEISRKGGKVVNTSSYTVSPDGKITTIEYTSNSVENGKPISGKLTQTRVGPGPAGAHAISGQWAMNKFANMSPEALTLTYRLDGDTLNMTSPDGTSYSAKLDGTETPIKGDIGGTTVSVTKTGELSWRTVEKRAGKITNTSDWTLDGDTLHVVSKNAGDGSTVTYDAKRQ